MPYDPDLMPQTSEEFELCVDHYYNLDQARYEREVQSAREEAIAAFNLTWQEKYDKLLAQGLSPMDAESALQISREQAINVCAASIEPPKTRQEISSHFISAGYLPQEEPGALL